jgi:CubicO group peptidase (beta-lactamase class C family)
MAATVTAVSRRWLAPLVVLAVLASGCAQSASPSDRASTVVPSADSADLTARIERVENGLMALSEEGQVLSNQGKALDARMRHHDVPGVSIAVINNYEVEWAKGYGVLEAGGTHLVTPGTLFNAGSIVKPVSAAAVLSLLERGLLDLDEDVNETLVSWQVPENTYTVSEKVTLRRLLSHSAGVTDGFTNRSSSDREPDYFAPTGEAPTVTIQQLLDAAPGVDVDGPTRVTAVPGTEFHYANADYAIVELLAVDVTQRPFAEFLEETVLKPLEMASSTCQRPLPDDLRARATTEHDVNGDPLDGKRHHYPFVSLWTTPSDLARFAIEIALASEGRSARVVSQESAKEMLTPQISTSGDLLREAYGLGFDLAGEGRGRHFFHTGGTWGSTAILWMVPATGQGAVVMTNSASNQGLLRFEILLAISAEYGWPLTAGDD